MSQRAAQMWPAPPVNAAVHTVCAPQAPAHACANVCMHARKCKCKHCTPVRQALPLPCLVLQVQPRAEWRFGPGNNLGDGGLGNGNVCGDTGSHRNRVCSRTETSPKRIAHPKKKSNARLVVRCHARNGRHFPSDTDPIGGACTWVGVSGWKVRADGNI